MTAVHDNEGQPTAVPLAAGRLARADGDNRMRRLTQEVGLLRRLGLRLDVIEEPLLDACRENGLLADVGEGECVRVIRGQPADAPSPNGTPTETAETGDPYPAITATYAAVEADGYAEAKRRDAAEAFGDTPDEHPDDPDDVLRVARAKFRVLDRDDLDNLPPPDPLIDGLLPAKGLAMLAGERSLGKSLLALDLAAHVSAGRAAWRGMDVARGGPVLYVALEGFGHVPNRVRAWEQHHGQRLDGVRWWPDPVSLSLDLHARMVSAIARDLGAVMVVVDSARATGAGAEDTKDMGQYVTGCETVASLTDALVLVLHNTGWDTTRERGSTLLPDACDTTMLLEGDPDGVRRLKHRKHRDGSLLAVPMEFAFMSVHDTDSGVLVPPTPEDYKITTATRLLSLVAVHPLESTTQLAKRVDRDRANTSRLLNALAAEGKVRNDGTHQKSAWVIPTEEPLP